MPGQESEEAVLLADESVLLATLVGLMLAQDRTADELGVLAGFFSSVSSVLALSAVVLIWQQGLEEKKKPDLEKRVAELEKQLQKLKTCRAKTY